MGVDMCGIGFAHMNNTTDTVPGHSDQVLAVRCLVVMGAPAYIVPSEVLELLQRETSRIFLKGFLGVDERIAEHDIGGAVDGFFV